MIISLVSHTNHFFSVPHKYTSADIATSWTSGVHFQVKQEILLYCRMLSLALGFTQPPIQCVLVALSTEVKWSSHEADYSSPSSAKVKNGGAIPHPLNTFSWCGA
jgi:hypothetical protein